MGWLQLLMEAWSVMKLGEDQKRARRFERGRVVIFNGLFASQVQTTAFCRHKRTSHVCSLGRDTHDTDTDAVRVYCSTDMVPRLHLHTLVGQDSVCAGEVPRETNTCG